MSTRPLPVLLALLLFSPATSPADVPPPPNIVLILSDDQAYTDYGFMGHPDIKTPHLDKLAASSAWFTRAYVPTALCRPSLMTFATGLYASQHRTSGNDPAQSVPQNSPEYQKLRADLIAHVDQHPTLPRLLGSERGYLSHQSGKWWEGNFKRGGFTHGMTRGFPEPGGRHGDDGLNIGRDGMTPIFDFIAEATAEKKPFFVWYAPFMPHTPHNPPARLLEKYKSPDRHIEVAKYHAMCEWFDETCGQLLDHLDEKGLSENTLVIYVCDNGWIQAEDGGFAPKSKQSPNEGGTRTPIMFRYPGKIKPGKRDDLVSSIDIVPTALAAAGIEIPKSLPGLNLLPNLGSGAPLERDTLFGEAFAHDIADIEDPEKSLLFRWTIEGDWKLLLTENGKAGRNAKVPPRDNSEPQLYNLAEDPNETKNLAKEHPDKVAALTQKIQTWYPTQK